MTRVIVHNYYQVRARDAEAKIVYNKLLGGWYVVTGPHQTPLNGRFNSKEEAEAWLKARGGKDSTTPNNPHGIYRYGDAKDVPGEGPLILEPKRPIKDFAQGRTPQGGFSPRRRGLRQV